MQEDITSIVLTSNIMNKYLFAAKQLFVALDDTTLRIIMTIDNTYFKHSNKMFKMQMHLSHEGVPTKELAYFSIYGNYIRAPFENLARITPLQMSSFSPPSMNIDCSDYRGRRVSKMLILLLIHFAKIEYPRFNDESALFIDVDASDIVGYNADGSTVSFWTAIGMVDNEINPANIISTGYDKRVIVKQLAPYLFR